MYNARPWRIDITIYHSYDCWPLVCIADASLRLVNSKRWSVVWLSSKFHQTDRRSGLISWAAQAGLFKRLHRLIDRRRDLFFSLSCAISWTVDRYCNYRTSRHLASIPKNSFTYMYTRTIVLDNTPYVFYNHVHVGQKRVQKMEAWLLDCRRTMTGNL